MRTQCVVLLLSVGLLMSGRARAAVPESTNAEQLNDEGKEAYGNEEFGKAIEKFRAAIAASPEARFYFNLCVALEKAETYEDAMDACNEVTKHQPSDELKQKVADRQSKIWAKIQKKKNQAPPAAHATTEPAKDTAPAQTEQPQQQQAANPAQPSAPEPLATGPRQTTAEPNAPEITWPAAPYVWSIGADVGPSGSRLANGYPKATVALLLHADYLLFPQLKMGARVYGGVYGASEHATLVGTIAGYTFTELGLGGYWHLALSPWLELTPLLGVHAASVEFNSGSLPSDSVSLGVGLHAELALQAILGGSNVLSLGLHVDSYSGNKADSNAEAIMRLEKGGSMKALMIGYTYRFKSASLGTIILE